jgi:hypothetical protein
MQNCARSRRIIRSFASAGPDAPALSPMEPRRCGFRFARPPNKSSSALAAETDERRACSFVFAEVTGSRAPWLVTRVEAGRGLQLWRALRSRAIAGGCTRKTGTPARKPRFRGLDTAEPPGAIPILGRVAARAKSRIGFCLEEMEIRLKRMSHNEPTSRNTVLWTNVVLQKARLSADATRAGPNQEGDRMPKATLVAARAVLTTIGIAGTASASPIRECGNIPEVQGSPAGVLNLTTRNVSCSSARRFAVQVTAQYPFPHRWAGFVCRDNYFDDGLQFDIRCVERSRVIHWQGGD